MAVLLGLITMGSVTSKAEPKKVVLIAGPIAGLQSTLTSTK
jgi:hypothetical protein